MRRKKRTAARINMLWPIYLIVIVLTVTIMVLLAIIAGVLFLPTRQFSSLSGSWSVLGSLMILLISVFSMLIGVTVLICRLWLLEDIEEMKHDDFLELVLKVVNVPQKSIVGEAVSSIIRLIEIRVNKNTSP